MCVYVALLRPRCLPCPACRSHWTPKYTMVAFTRIPYSEALQRSRRQEQWMSAMGYAAGVAVLAAAAVGARVAVKVPHA